MEGQQGWVQALATYACFAGCVSQNVCIFVIEKLVVWMGEGEGEGEERSSELVTHVDVLLHAQTEVAYVYVLNLCVFNSF
jgi:hypothetical protein